MVIGDFRVAALRSCRSVLVLLSFALAGTDGSAAADLQRGGRIFRACASCHVLDDERNTFGPYLKGIAGRRAGTAPGYAYSTAMTAAGQAGLVWDDTSLAKYLQDPSATVPGTKMRFWGLWSSEVEDLLAYLKAHP